MAAHENEHHHHAPAKIHVIHATAPTCWWSWGYEALFNRLPLVYGDQIDISVHTFCVYEDLNEWMKHMEVTWEDLPKEQAEGAAIMGVPLASQLKKEAFPPTVYPATIAVAAAKLQDGHKAKRFLRSLIRRQCVEMQDVTKDSVLEEALKEAGLDVARFRKDYADKVARNKEVESQGQGLPHLPLGFYNVAITDGHGRHVIIDHAFDPARVEGAIEWLSGGKLKKAQPSDIVGYLREHGPAPTVELARVFAIAPKAAEDRLQGLVKEKMIEAVTLGGAAHWRASGKA